MAIPLAPEDLLDIIQTLKKQETSAYHVLDYLNPNDPLPHDDDRACRMCRPAAAATRTERSASDAESSLAYSTSTGSSSHSGVNEDWRSKIVEWAYQVIDHLDYDREIVAVALHYLDRYLCRRSVDKRTFQLVSMTCLHTACKIYSLRRQQLSMASLMQLSRGYFTEDQIFATERSILAYVHGDSTRSDLSQRYDFRANFIYTHIIHIIHYCVAPFICSDLGWYMHPPTPLTFAKHFVLLLDPNACSSQVWHDMMEVAKFLTELAVTEYPFAPLKPSSVGLAALMTSMEEVSDEDLTMDAKEAFAANVCQLAHIDPTSPEVMDCRIRLRQIYVRIGASAQDGTAIGIGTPSRPTSAKGEVERIKADSPTGVDETNLAPLPPNSDAPPLDGKKSKGEASKKEISSSYPSNGPTLFVDTTSNTSPTTSTTKTNGSSDKTKAATRTSIASKAKKLRKTTLSSQKVKEAKKRRAWTD